MPGYGFAAVGKEKVASWSQLMRDYLRGRASLARVFVLVDGRRGVKPLDEEMFDLLDQSAVSYQVVLTKHDELKIAERNEVLAATLTALAKRSAAFPEVIFTSAHCGEGIPELRAAIAKLIVERNA
jgi:GTP-binding protein